MKRVAPKVHLKVSLGRVACGAETSWRTRGRDVLDLPMQSSTRGVGCARCRSTSYFAIVLDRETETARRADVHG